MIHDDLSKIGKQLMFSEPFYGIFLSTLNKVIKQDLKNNYTIVADVGAHQMWAAQFIDYDYNKVRFITSGGLGSMGYALPASIGAKIGINFKFNMFTYREF